MLGLHVFVGSQTILSPLHPKQTHCRVGVLEFVPRTQTTQRTTHNTQHTTHNTTHTTQTHLLILLLKLKTTTLRLCDLLPRLVHMVHAKNCKVQLLKGLHALFSSITHACAVLVCLLALERVAEPGPEGLDVLVLVQANDRPD